MGKLGGVMSSNPPQLSLSYDDGGERLQWAGLGVQGRGRLVEREEWKVKGWRSLRGGRRTKQVNGQKEGGQEPRGGGGRTQNTPNVSN